MNAAKNKHQITNQSGQAVIAVTVILLVVSIAIVLGGVSPALSARKIARELIHSKQAAALSDSGVEDLSFRVVNGMIYDSSEIIEMGGESVTTTIADDFTTGDRLVQSDAKVERAARSRKVTLVQSNTVGFGFGVHAGQGGLTMVNNSKIIGDAFSNRHITGSNSASVEGDALAAGPDGHINNMVILGSAWANTIEDSQIGVDAYYDTIIGSLVEGTGYANSPDQDTVPLPISNETLDIWQSDAEASGVISEPCPYKVSGSETLGPVMINCDLEIRNGAELTLAGTVWVKGNIEFKTSTKTIVDPSLGGDSVAMIAYDPNNTSSGSVIDILNSAEFIAPPESFVMLISRNDSAAGGSSASAISVKNSTQGSLILYSNEGRVHLRNSVEGTSVAAFEVLLENSTELRYDEALQHLSFPAGSGDSWEMVSTSEK